VIPRRALVTGASSGIGAAVAVRLAQQGWQVLASGRDAGRLAALAASHGGAISTVTADLTVEADLRRLAADATATPLHALVHAAGVVALGPLASATVEDLDRQWAINLRAPYALTRLLLPTLREARGHVVFVNSGSGRRANPGWGAYAATKFGLRAVADALRAEESAHGVRVTSVYPGRTDTPMQRAVFAAEGRAYEPTGLVSAAAVAEAVEHALATPPPALLADIEIRPG
jgi:NAD(P)-dependent dehydrogenase (short-subunit alcohol dehydrogenase family)